MFPIGGATATPVRRCSLLRLRTGPVVSGNSADANPPRSQRCASLLAHRGSKCAPRSSGYQERGGPALAMH